MLSSFSFSSYTYFDLKKHPAYPKKGKGKSSAHDDLISIVGPSFKNKNLTEALKVKGLSKKHKQSLCLVWFVHNVLWARDVNNNISLILINLSEDLEAFNNYPWGYESFKMTVEYLLTPLTPKAVNLYGFSWAFMDWAFEVRPPSDLHHPLIHDYALEKTIYHDHWETERAGPRKLKKVCKAALLKKFIYVFLLHNTPKFVKRFPQLTFKYKITKYCIRVIHRHRNSKLVNTNGFDRITLEF
ncbi:hypothetical protein BC332_27077 [Capsicum chinense]|nr:hypothetical protein BC332_27077 [Capsicum chinense]